jgi:hypothetical protein
MFTPGNPVSEAFYSERAFKAHVKSPTEYVVSSLQLLKPNGIDNRGLVRVLLPYMTQMGQYLFDPPDVSGWKEGLNWINTTFDLARFNFANGFLALGRTQGGIDVNAILQQNGFLQNGQLTATPEQLVDFFTGLMLQSPVSPQTRQTLINYLNAPSANPNETDFINMKVRGMIRLIMSSPDFQLS